MPNILLYFYPGIIIISTLTSYTDIKNNSIKNKHLLIGIIYGSLAYLYIFLNNSIHLSFHQLCLNILTSLGIAYILYLAHLWSAGDAKLFIVLSFLTPFFDHNNIFQLPAIALFINVNILSLIFIIIIRLKNLIAGTQKLDITIAKKIIRKIPNSLIIIFSITWIVWYLSKKIHFSNQLSIFVFLYLSYQLIYIVFEKIKFHKAPLILLIVFGIVMRLLLQPQILFSFKLTLLYFTRIFKYTLVFSVLNLLLFTTEKIKNQNQQTNSALIAFAPFLCLGAIMVDIPLVNYVLRLVDILRR